MLHTHDLNLGGLELGMFARRFEIRKILNEWQFFTVMEHMILCYFPYKDPRS